MVNLKAFIIQGIISSISILIGTLVGALLSWITSKKTTLRTIEEQYKIIEDNRKYDEKCKYEEVKREATIVRLDVCTAVFQSIRGIQMQNEKDELVSYPIPFNNRYSRSISMLSFYYNLKDISYIYQLYGIIQRLSGAKNHGEYVFYCKDLIKKIYGDNSNEIYNINIDKISYEEVFGNKYIKDEYKKIIDKLNNLSG